MRNVLLGVAIAVVGVGLLATRLVFVQHQQKVAVERTQSGSSEKIGPTSTPPAERFLERLRAISGTAANRCGTTSLSEPDASIYECGLKAFQDHKAFFLSYYTKDGQTVQFGYGLASNSAGDVFALTYDGGGFQP